MLLPSHWPQTFTTAFINSCFLIPIGPTYKCHNARADLLRQCIPLGKHVVYGNAERVFFLKDQRRVDTGCQWHSLPVPAERLARAKPSFNDLQQVQWRH